MLSLMTTIKWPASMIGSATAGCWLKDGLLLFLEIGLLAWVLFAAMSVTLIFKSGCAARKSQRPIRIRPLTQLTILLTVLLVWSVSTAAGQTQKPVPESKSSLTALVYSLAGTLIPAGAGTGVLFLTESGNDKNKGTIAGIGIGIGVAGLVFGPGLGHAYAGRPGPFKGALWRLSALAVCGIGIGQAAGANYGSGPNPGANTGAAVLILAGGIGLLYSTVHDIATVDRSVEEYNRRHAQAGINIAPYYLAQHKTAGIAITLSL